MPFEDPASNLAGSAFLLTIGANPRGAPCPKPMGMPGAIPHPYAGGQKAGIGCHGGHIPTGGQNGGGPQASLGRGRHFGRQLGPLTRQSTTLKGKAITPATSLQHPLRIRDRPFSLHLGAHMRGGHMGGGHMGGGPQVGGGQGGGAHTGGGIQYGGGQTGPPAEAGMAATTIKRPAAART